MRCGTLVTVNANGGRGEGGVRLACEQMCSDHRLKRGKGREGPGLQG